VENSTADGPYDTLSEQESVQGFHQHMVPFLASLLKCTQMLIDLTNC